MQPLSQFFEDPKIRRNLMLTSLWVVLLVSLWVSQEVLLPFIIAGFLGYILNPLVTKANKKGLWGKKPPRWVAVLMVYFAFFGILYLSSIFIGPQIAKEMVKLTETTTQLADQLTDEKIDVFARQAENKLAEYNINVRILGPKGPQPQISANSPESLFTLDIGLVWRQMLKDSALYLKQETRQILGQVQVLITGLMGFFFKFFLVLMLTAFLLADIERVKRFFFSMIPLEDQTEYDGLMGRFDHGLSGVVRGQLLICLVNGVLTLFGLLILKVKFAFVLAILASVFSLIPIFGTIISTLPIMLVGLTQSLFTGVAALIWILIIHFIEGNFLNPKIMGDASKIHPALIVLALLTGQHFYGISGALFAVPIASIFVTVFMHVLNKAQVLDRNITLPPPSSQPPKV
jgi:predicted PurR-regulated permease PerM